MTKLKTDYHKELEWVRKKLKRFCKKREYLYNVCSDIPLLENSRILQSEIYTKTKVWKLKVDLTSSYKANIRHILRSIKANG